MLSFKPDVRIGDCDERLALVFHEACIWSYRTRVGVEVNSVEDGAAVHMPTSLHAYGLAVDLDTAGDKAADTQQLGEWMRRRLPPAYDVVFEGDHVHVEWDARRADLKKLAG